MEGATDIFVRLQPRLPVDRAPGQEPAARGAAALCGLGPRAISAWWRFAEAWSKADFPAMREMMAESAALVVDRGGIVTSFPEPMVGGQRIAQLLFASTLRDRDDL